MQLLEDLFAYLNFKRLAFICFLATGIIGLLAIVGWKLDIEWLFQFIDNTAPTQFNAAVCFLMLSVATIGYSLKYIRLALVAACTILFFTLLTAVQYLFEIDVSIDQLLHQHQITTNTSHPGRMAPNTALSFLLLAMGLCWLIIQPTINKISIYFNASLISLVLAISAVSVVGYIINIETSYGWGKYTHMSLQAAMGFCFAAIGMLFISTELSKNANNGDFHLSIIVGAVLFSMTLLFTNAISAYQNNKVAQLESSARELIERDINLLWQVDSIYFSKVATKSTLKSIPVDSNLVSNQSIQAIYLIDQHGKSNTLYSQEPSIDLYPLVNNRAYVKTQGDRIANSLEFRYSNLFSFSRDQYFSLKLAVESNNTAAESLVILFDFKLWLKRYVKPILPSGVELKPLADYRIELSDITNRKNVTKDNQISRSQLDIGSSQSDVFTIKIANIELRFSYNESFYQNILDISSLVLVFGLILTFLSILVSIYFQKSHYKSLSLKSEITARKRFEEELRKSHLALQLATNSADLGIWTWDVESGKLDWTAQMHLIYETPDEVKNAGLIYDFWYNSVHPDDIEVASSSLQKAVEKRQDWQAEYRLLLNKNRVKHIKATAICFTDNATGRLTVIGANQDITKEKTLLENLAEKSDVAEQNSVAKTKFLANMSHEIRTPMNAILGIGDLMKATKLDAKQYEYMKLILGSAHRLMDLINDILDISKIEAGELTIENVCFPLEEVLADAAKNLANQAHQKGLDYHFFASSNLPIWVKSDPVRLSQILTNIVSNAIKFTEQGEVVVRLNLNSLKEKKNDIVRIEIKVVDTGIGIAESKINSLFHPFSQADESTTRKYGGTGLGLSIVRELVDLLDGKVEIESRLGAGSKVSVYLDMQLGDEESNSVGLTDDYDFYLHSDRNVLGSLNCLVVDNHPSNRAWLTDMLHSWHCNVTACENSEDALSAILESRKRKRDFDAIIIEAKLPEQDGFEFIEQVKQWEKEGKSNWPDTILLLNASNLASDLDRCESLGVKTHLVKPIKQSEVFNALMSVLGKNPNKSLTHFPEEKVDSQKSLKILVAEDHEVNSFLVQEILEKRGHSVTVVENGRLAYEENSQYYFDAILMDVQMPVMDGIEATEMIRNSDSNSEVCIVGLTARALKEDAQVCLQAGMNYYLTKPVNPGELVEVLENEEIRAARQIVASEPSSKQAADEQVINHDIEFLTFDEQHALFTTESDIELLAKMLTMASGFIDEAVAEQSNLLKEKNWTSLAKKVHKTKGMLANFCHESLTEELELIIEKIETRDFEQVGKLLNEGNARIVRLKHEIASYLSRPKPAENMQ
jgi:signal transduction histidine kinase/CheY-like chemotaxis protein